MGRERPILFSAPMVRALLAGTKTQTRRAVKPQPSAGVRRSPFVPSGLEDGHGRELRCPYGVPGDRLWVREVWRAWERASDCLDHIWYRADDAKIPIPNTKACGDFVVGKFDRWRPGIHMPRWASRITLEVTEVRVQRLQEISEADARAEGVDSAAPTFYSTAQNPDDDREDPREVGYAVGSFARDNFQRLWEHINGTDSWYANPWVWAISFRVEPRAPHGGTSE